LIGDECTDEYIYGTIDRLSPEAPVPVFVPHNKETKRGMAGNVEENLLALGCNVATLSGEKSTKTRFIDARSKQHIMRLDQDKPAQPLILETLIPPVYDAVVVSDYNKGLVTYELVETILKQFNGPVFIDTKKTDLARFNGAFVKINSLEYSLAKTLSDNLIVTLGKDGTRYKDTTYPAPQVEVADVCGAGDTFLSALVYEYLNTNSIPQAIEFANRAASVTVKHTGVYAPKLKEINAA
jgi:D-beta-D-heptose 7-phosphate kinase/D-beta-D-heptose 1-phosphate adenosyltransferase